jgi:hypothetical protein
MFLVLPFSARIALLFILRKHRAAWNTSRLFYYHISALAAASRSGTPALELQLCECVCADSRTAAAKDACFEKKDDRLLRIKIVLHRCDSDTGLLADVRDGGTVLSKVAYSLEN